MLRVCRLGLVAPVRLEARRGARVVCLSPVLCVVGFIVVSILDATTLFGLIMDFNLPPSKSNRAGTPTRRVVWVFDVTIVMLTMTVGVLRAPTRMKEVIMCLDQIHKITSSLKGVPTNMAAVEKKKCVILISFLTASILLIAADYCYFIEEILSKGRDETVAALYSCYFVGFVVMHLMEIQFVFTILEVYRAMRSVNHLLENIAYSMKDNVEKVLNTNNYLNDNTNIPAHTISRIVDCMALGSYKYQKHNKTTKPLTTTAETICSLVLKYEQLCIVMRRLNICFGPELVVFILSCFFHLVITPYNLLGTIHVKKISVRSVLTQGAWCVWHFFCSAAAVEPPYITHLEMDRTHYLVSHMLLHNTDDSIHAELVKFTKVLLLNNVTYSPMGAFTLSRSLVVSMVASVATYLVIIIQFQASEMTSD